MLYLSAKKNANKKWLNLISWWAILIEDKYKKLKSTHEQTKLE